MDFIYESIYSIRGVRGARKYIYTIGISLKQLQLETLERVQILAHRYYPSEGRIKSVDLLPAFRSFQRKVRERLWLRRMQRCVGSVAALRKREEIGTDLATVLKQSLMSN